MYKYYEFIIYFNTKLRAITCLIFSLSFFVKHYLKIKLPGSVLICETNVQEYTRDVFKRHGLLTIKDITLAYINTEKLDGVGKSTWNDFFETVR